MDFPIVDCLPDYDVTERQKHYDVTAEVEAGSLTTNPTIKHTTTLPVICVRPLVDGDEFESKIIRDDTACRQGTTTLRFNQGTTEESSDWS